MTKKNSAKKALFASLLSLLLCVTMLIGTTFAWFTDSVTSAGNIITSGTLNIDMSVMDETGMYHSVKENSDTIFGYTLWEPGYTEWRNVKVSTTGNLALKYAMNIVINGERSILTDVIDVYYAASEVAKPADRSLDGLTRLGTMSEVLDGATDALINDSLVPAEGNTEDYATIVLKMQESAGNDYQEKTVGEFDIKLLATQLTYEDDSFDDQYDANAKFDGAADVWDGTADTAWYNAADTSFALSTAEELAGLTKLASEGTNFSGKTIELESNMDFNGEQWTPIKKFAGTLKGNDHAIGNFSVDATAAHGGFIDVLEWGTIEDVTLSNITAKVGNYRFGALARSINQSNIENVTVKNVNVTTAAPGAFVAGLFATGTVNSNMEVNNCTVENMTVNANAGAYLIGGITTVVQKNGTEAEGTNIFENLNVKNFKVAVHDTDGVCGVGGLVGQTQSVWQNPRFNNCSVSGLDVTATGSVDVGGFICYPGSVTFAENCTAEGKIDVSGVTSADDYAGGFFANYGWGDNISKGDHKVTSCSADVDITTKAASAGGFVGSGTNSEGRNKNITLTGCEAKGTVTLADGGTANIGGFAGQTDRGIYVNCSAAQTPFIGKVLDGCTLTDDGNGTLTVSK